MHGPARGVGNRGLIGLNAWVAYGNAVEAANEAYDRSLYLAARTLAEETNWSHGKVQVDLLRAAGYLFANHTGSRLFYQIRDDRGYWSAIEHYLSARLDARFTHGICPACAARLYPEGDREG